MRFYYLLQECIRKKTNFSSLPSNFQKNKDNFLEYPNLLQCFRFLIVIAAASLIIISFSFKDVIVILLT